MSRFLLAPTLALVLCWAGPARAETLELTNRMVSLSGSVNSSSVAKVVKKILELDEQSHEPIWLMIDSHGGSVDAGFILIDLMRSLRSPVYAVVISKAYSMGAIITLYAQKRYIYEHATMMLHEASYGALGEDPSIRSRIEFNTKYLDRIHEELAKILKMPYAKYRANIRDAWWVMGKEAVKANFVDAVVTNVRYRELGVETTEVKKTTLIKTKTMSRPARSGPQALDISK